MAMQDKLKETFLIFDRNGAGKLDKSSVLTALSSVGFVLNHDEQSKINAMNMQEFVDFGEELAKTKSPENCVQQILNNLMANGKGIKAKDFEHIAAAISCMHSNDIKGFISTVDPDCTGVINPTRLQAQLLN